MKIRIKRAYDEAFISDGYRVLVDQLWPRGVSKEKAKIDLWAKDIAPSADLRSWFHEDPEKRYGAFSKRYTKELTYIDEVSHLKTLLKEKKIVTLVTAVKDIEHSHVPILLQELFL